MSSIKPVPGRVYRVREQESRKSNWNSITGLWSPQAPARELLLMIIAIYPDHAKKRRHAKKMLNVVGWQCLVFWLDIEKNPRVERIYVADNDKDWKLIF